MLQQDFQPHQNQNNAACKLCFGLETVAEQLADPNAEHGKRQRDRTDKGNSRHNADFQEGKGNTDHQRVNAGGDCQRQHRFERNVSAVRLLIAQIETGQEKDTSYYLEPSLIVRESSSAAPVVQFRSLHTRDMLYKVSE